MTYTETLIYLVFVGVVWAGTLVWLLYENVHHEVKRRRDG